MPAGARPGERRGGRLKGGRNKATIARMEALQEVARVAGASPSRVSMRAKDELMELAGAIKGHVAQFQLAAMAGGQGGPGGPKHNRETWSDFREWLSLLSQVLYRLADFQDPKFRAIAVATPPDLGGRLIEAVPVNEAASQEEAMRAYFEVVKGGKKEAANAG